MSRRTIISSLFLVAIAVVAWTVFILQVDSQQSGSYARGEATVRYYSYSDKAARARKLISDGAYDANGAAETLLDATLPGSPDDAGLYIQYARLVVLSRNFSTSAFFSPTAGVGIPGLSKEWPTGLSAVRGLMNLAKQFDPSCTAHASEEVLAAVYQRAKAKHDEDGGVSSVGSGDCYTDAALVAYQFDALSAKPWAAAFDALKPAAIRTGKPFSTFRLSNLVSTMEGLTGVEQFRAVNADVIKALAVWKPQAKGDGEVLRQLYQEYFPSLGAKDDSTFASVLALIKEHSPED